MDKDESYYWAKKELQHDKEEMAREVKKDGMTDEFKKLAVDLYNEGYHCGISDEESDKWYGAWALAMQKIANGCEYTDDLVNECYRNG